MKEKRRTANWTGFTKTTCTKHAFQKSLFHNLMQNNCFKTCFCKATVTRKRHNPLVQNVLLPKTAFLNTKSKELQHNAA